MNIPDAFYLLILGATLGYHLGWKRGNRAGLKITVMPPVINVVTKDDSTEADWWKDNDQQNPGL